MIVNKQAPYYHDLLTITLYKDMAAKITDLDTRLIDHAHVIRGADISSLGGYHDALFFLKSLDLDLKYNYSLGTVCGYGRDEYER